MNLKIKYWYWNKALPDHMCDHIIKLGEEKKKQFGVVGHNENKELTDKDIEDQKKTIRDSNVAWFNEPWMFDLLSRYFLEANQNAEWHFMYDFIEPVQFTMYEPGQYYGFHQDSDFFKNEETVRKLSCVISLSDPSEYEGGDFRMNLKSGLHGSDCFLDVEHLKGKGNLIVFPSHFWHEVSKITKGKRYSLVAWAKGPPFR